MSTSSRAFIKPRAVWTGSLVLWRLCCGLARVQSCCQVLLASQKKAREVITSPCLSGWSSRIWLPEQSSFLEKADVTTSLRNREPRPRPTMLWKTKRRSPGALFYTITSLQIQRHSMYKIFQHTTFRVKSRQPGAFLSVQMHLIFTHTKPIIYTTFPRLFKKYIFIILQQKLVGFF